ncbi:hypothetical protein HK104_008806 [Borealophlyctis nickersoniae]|nr:hypothetical protein HK104_008806 [Borealophlyctis nickersoniae]
MLVENQTAGLRGSSAAHASRREPPRLSISQSSSSPAPARPAWNFPLPQRPRTPKITLRIEKDTEAERPPVHPAETPEKALRTTRSTDFDPGWSIPATSNAPTVACIKNLPSPDKRTCTDPRYATATVYREMVLAYCNEKKIIVRPSCAQVAPGASGTQIEETHEAALTVDTSEKEPRPPAANASKTVNGIAKPDDTSARAGSTVTTHPKRPDHRWTVGIFIHTNVSWTQIGLGVGGLEHEATMMAWLVAGMNLELAEEGWCCAFQRKYWSLRAS